MRRDRSRFSQRYTRLMPSVTFTFVREVALVDWIAAGAAVAAARIPSSSSRAISLGFICESRVSSCSSLLSASPPAPCSARSSCAWRSAIATAASTLDSRLRSPASASSPAIRCCHPPRELYSFSVDSEIDQSISRSRRRSFVRLRRGPNS
ncbi:MAG: hypothetical protein V3S31_01880 [Dehalococcoidia bacterium]